MEAVVPHKGIKKTDRLDIDYSFAGKTVMFERMTRPIPEYKNKKLVNFLALEVVLKDEVSNETNRVLVDATGKVKERLMKERICPWSFDGFNYGIEMTFDKNGIAVDYDLIYKAPDRKTHYDFELVDDVQYKYSGPSSVQESEYEEGEEGRHGRSKHSSAEKPYAVFTRLESPKDNRFVYVKEYDYFNNENLKAMNAVETVQKNLNKYLSSNGSTSENLKGVILGLSKNPKFVIIDDDGTDIVVNLMPL